MSVGSLQKKYSEKLNKLYRSHRTRILAFGAILLFGMLYALWVWRTGRYIPCLFRQVTGWACPGCGISHMCMELLHLDFYGAFRQNAGVFLLAVLWGLYGLLCLLFRIRTKKGDTFFALFGLIMMLLFGILRNIPAFSFLLPLYLQ